MEPNASRGPWTPNHAQQRADRIWANLRHQEDPAADGDPADEADT